MAGLARLVLPGIPYHVTQRGIRRQPTFSRTATSRCIAICWPRAHPRAGASGWA